MSLPDPKPGLVISYSYLWRHQAVAGEEEGRKNRPCAIITSVKKENEKLMVTVLPITHSQPENLNDAIELPEKVKRHLGLDSERSWILCNEANRFPWPGPDIRTVSYTDKNKFAYGLLPFKLFSTARTKFLYLARGRRLKIISRSE